MVNHFTLSSTNLSIVSIDTRASTGLVLEGKGEGSSTETGFYILNMYVLHFKHERITF